MPINLNNHGNTYCTLQVSNTPVKGNKKTGSVTYSLPGAPPSSSSLLQSDPSGVMSWASAGGGSSSGAFTVSGNTATSSVDKVTLPGNLVCTSTGFSIGTPSGPPDTSFGKDYYLDYINSPYLKVNLSPTTVQLTPYLSLATPAVTVRGTLATDTLQVGGPGFNRKGPYNGGYANLSIDQYGEIQGVDQLTFLNFQVSDNNDMPVISYGDILNMTYHTGRGGGYDTSPALTKDGLINANTITGLYTLKFADGSSMTTAASSGGGGSSSGAEGASIGKFGIAGDGAIPVSPGATFSPILSTTQGLQGVSLTSPTFTVLAAGMYSLTFDFANGIQYDLGPAPSYPQNNLTSIQPSTYNSLTWAIVYTSQTGGAAATVTSPPYQFSTGTTRYFYKNETFRINVTNGSGKTIQLHPGTYGANVIISAVYG